MQESKVITALLLALLVVLVTSLAFGLGRISTLREGREPVEIKYDFSALNLERSDDPKNRLNLGTGAVVGSINGEVYHLPWCSGAQRIKQENLIVFESQTEAQEAGYTPAQNCPGLE